MMTVLQELDFDLLVVAWAREMAEVVVVVVSATALPSIFYQELIFHQRFLVLEEKQQVAVEEEVELVVAAAFLVEDEKNPSNVVDSFDNNSGDICKWVSVCCPFFAKYFLISKK